MFLKLSEVYFALSLAQADTDVDLTGVSTDTRTIKPGMLFVALRGENFDGHEYVDRAFELGAVAAIVSQPSLRSHGREIVVSDTLIAYGTIARTWRLHFDIPVIAVTGSVGKTTVKEMLALGLSTLGPVLKSEKNENNEVGVPQTLLRLNEKHRAVVIEMGMRGAGQIKYLADIVQPTVGLITIIGESHIEILGSRDAIADAKGELIEALTTHATAVLNADDPYYSRLAAKAPGGILSYGTSGNADVRVLDYRQSDSGRWAKLEIDGDGYGIQVNSPATHDIRNAAAAIAAAVAVGVSPRDAVVDVERYVPSNMRMEVLSSRSGGKILSDCYNAAPSSVKSALLTLSEIRSRGVKSAFLGDMRELGSFTFDMHKDVAAEASRLGIDHVYPIGDAMRQAFPDAPASFANSEEAAHYISAGFVLGPDDFVLVKGSRALQLETVVKALVYL